MTTISILGKGNMGSAIAGLAEKAGHTVEQLDSSDTDKPVTGDVVVLAVPYAAVADIVTQRGQQLAGKVVVDITNPVNDTYDALVTPPDGSAAQEFAGIAPGARLVKAFNTTFATTLAEGSVAGEPLDVFIAADDDDAKRLVAKLVEDGGMRAIDAGPLTRARELEAAGLLHMAVQQPLGTNFASALKILA